MTTTTGLLLLGIAALIVGTCIGWYIRKCARDQMEMLSYLKPGFYVRAQVHTAWSVPDTAVLKESVEGEVKTVHDDGTMTVRCYESGSIYRCNQSGYFPIAREEAYVMRQLRKEDDIKRQNRAIGESPSNFVH